MKRILGLVLLLLALAGMVNVVSNWSKLSATPSTGSAAYQQGQKVGRYTGVGVIVAVGLLGAWLLLQGNDSRPAPTPPRRPGTLPQPGDPSLRGGQDTFAGNPALLRLNAGQWLAANPWVIIVASVLALLGFIFLFVKLPVGIVLLLSAVIIPYQNVQRAQRKFYMGDVCPGVVLSAQHNLVAVYTDMQASARFPHPAIKILKQPLHRITTEAAYDGMRVATAALYYGFVQRPAWQDFEPEVIQCVVHDPEELGRVMASISEAEWQALDSALAQVPVAQPGLYRLWDTAPSAYPSADGQPQSAPEFTPAKSWFATTPGIITLSILGALAGLMVLISVAGWALRAAQRRNATSYQVQTPTPPPTPSAQRPSPPTAAGPAEPTQTGPYTAGANVVALWAGQPIAGKIVSLNPGGFSVMVQLQDSRFPRPIIMSTNQIRLRVQ